MTPPRPISDAEAELLRIALTRFPVSNVAPALLATIDGLTVTVHCQCGCDSVGFEGDEPARATLLADAMGRAPSGEEVGVLVFGDDTRLHYLEVYNFAEGPARLPLPYTLGPFGSPLPLDAS